MTTQTQSPYAPLETEYSIRGYNLGSLFALAPIKNQEDLLDFSELANYVQKTLTSDPRDVGNGNVLPDYGDALHIQVMKCALYPLFSKFSPYIDQEDQEQARQLYRTINGTGESATAAQRRRFRKKIIAIHHSIANKLIARNIEALVEL